METSAAQLRREAWLGACFDCIAHDRLFVWLPVALGCGIGVYFALPFEPDARYFWPLIFGALLLPMMAGRLHVVLPLVWLCAAALIGFGTAGLHSYGATAPVLELRYYGPIEGRVVGIDRSGSDKLRLTLDQVRLDRVAPKNRPVKVRVSLHGAQPFVDPRPGQTLMMTGHLSPPAGPVEPSGFDFQRHAWFQQIGGVGYTRVPALLQYPARDNNLSIRIFALRMTLSRAITERLPGREGAFATAILTGDRSSIDPGALDALRASNLAHLLAISGLHMGLLTGVVFAMIRIGLATVPGIAMRLDPKKIAACVAFCVAVSYLLVSGASVATQRAFIMVAVMLVALCLDRRALTLRAVAVAALIVLLASPDSLAGPGFQMSFAATTALVAVFAEIRDRQLWVRWPKWARNLASLVISSAIAGFATAPFGAYHFNQMAQWGLLANLASVPVMGMVVMPGAVLAAVLSPLGLESLGFEVMRLGIRWILFVAETVASWETALQLIPQPDGYVLPLLGLGGAGLCLLRSYRRVVGVVILGVALGLWGMSTRPALLISDTGTLIGVLGEGGRALNKPKGDGFVAGAWLENDGDAADQVAASARSDFTRNEARFVLNGHVVHFVRAKDLNRLDLSQLCHGADLLILPETTAPPDCPALTKISLRRSGSVAVTPSTEGLVVKTSKEVRGDRLWVR